MIAYFAFAIGLVLLAHGGSPECYYAFDRYGKPWDLFCNLHLFRAFGKRVFPVKAKLENIQQK